MKTIWRILVILLVGTAVAGGTYIVGQSPWVTQRFGFRDGGRPERGLDNDDDGFRPDQGDFQPGARPESNEGFRGERGGRGGINLFAVTGFVRTLLPMTVVIAAVVVVSWIGDKVRRQRRDRQSVADTAVP